jgi:hypothetical protein
LLKIEKYIIETDILIRARSKRIYAISNYFAHTKSFRAFTIIVILLNTVVLGLTHYKSSRNFEKSLDQTNIGFFAFFVIELIIKLLGRGFKHYLRDRFNWFDGVVVIVSSIDIIISYTIKESKTLSLI